MLVQDAHSNVLQVFQSMILCDQSSNLQAEQSDQSDLGILIERISQNHRGQPVVGSSLTE